MRILKMTRFQSSRQNNVQEIKHYEDLETKIKQITKARKDEVAKLKEELANANENFEVEKAKKEKFLVTKRISFKRLLINCKT